MKAVILEDYAIQQGDLDWSGVKALVPDVTRYGRTAPEEVVPRIGDAEIVFLNKCRIDETVLARCPKLRWVGIIATGTDNLDLQACRRHGVPVANVPGYSTHSVAQMTFSLLLAICQCADRYDRLVQDGRWRTEDPAAYGLLPQVELLGKTFGIYGYGSIGRQTARIAKAFGMECWCAPAPFGRSTPPTGWSSWILTPCLPAAMCSACTARQHLPRGGWSTRPPLQRQSPA